MTLKGVRDKMQAECRKNFLQPLKEQFYAGGGSVFYAESKSNVRAATMPAQASVVSLAAFRLCLD